jgi:hypothetical protein
MRRISGSGQWNELDATARIIIDGTDSGYSVVPFDTRNTTDWILLKTYTKNNVAHNSNGSKSISIQAYFNPNATSSLSNGYVGGTFTLDTIARATNIVLSSVMEYAGSSLTITLSPADSSFKHKIRYEFGSLVSQLNGITYNGRQVEASEYIGSGNVTFTIPTSLTSQIPNANSGSCKIILYTYRSDGTHIGTKEQNLIVKVPEYTPTISGIGITGNNLLNGLYVQGKSSMSVAISAYSHYGAGIISISSVVEGVAYSGANFTTRALASGDATVAVAVTIVDSRNRSVTLTSEAKTVYAYHSPYITDFTLERQSGNETTVIATAKGSVASVNGQNGKTIQVTLNGVTLTVSANGTATFTDISTDKAFTGTARISDNYTSATKDFVLSTVAVTMDFHSSGKGVAFGKVAEHENTLEVAWNIKNDSVPTLLGGMGKAISANSDINTTAFITPGNYVCALNDTAKTLTNTPTSFAFKMRVYNCLDTWTNVQTGSYMYLIREITNLDGTNWVQYVRKEGGGWYFAPWRLLLDDSKCHDYIIEQGVVDGWEYTRWNNGKMEFFGEKQLNFPALEQQTDYLWRSICQFNLSNWFVKITSGSCPIQVNGMVPQVCRHSSNLATAEIVIVTSRYASAFSVTAPVYIVGKWK